MMKNLRIFWDTYIGHSDFWKTLALIALYCLHVFSLFLAVAWLFTGVYDFLNRRPGQFYLPLIPLAVALATGALRVQLKNRANPSNDIRTTVVESIFALIMIVYLSIADTGFLSAFLGAALALSLFGLTKLFECAWKNEWIKWLQIEKKYFCIFSAVAYSLICPALDSGIRYIDLALTEIAWNQITLWVMFELVHALFLASRSQMRRGVWPFVPKENKLYTMRFFSRRTSAASQTVRLFGQGGSRSELLELCGQTSYENEEYVWLLPTFYHDDMANSLIILKCLSEKNAEEENVGEKYETVIDPALYMLLYNRFKRQYSLTFEFCKADDELTQPSEASGESTTNENKVKSDPETEAKTETGTETD